MKNVRKGFGIVLVALFLFFSGASVFAEANDVLNYELTYAVNTGDINKVRAPITKGSSLKP